MATNNKLVLPITVAVVLLAAGGYFVAGLMKSERTQASVDSADSAMAVAAATAANNTNANRPEDLERILAEAKAANEKGQLVSPKDINAVELYLRALAIDPNNAVARDALTELMPYAMDRTDQYITERNIAEAERALDLLRKADPSSTVILTSLAGKIENLKRLEITNTQEQQTALIAQQEEAARLARERAAALASTESPSATETPEPGSTPAESTTPTPAPVRTTPAPTVASTAPTPSVAPTPAPSLENKNFQLQKKVSPAFPQRAMRQRLEGWVELSFTVTASGDVADIKVVDAKPRREFDREAIRALSQWKFSPRIENGKAVAATARQRLEFKLNDG
jgi:periplasmic protein TonB